MKITRSILLFLLLTALFASLLSGCATPTPAPTTLTDGLGRSVTLPAPAQRIVSLTPSNTEILFALGAGAQVVGRDEFSNYPAEVSSLPGVGGSMGKYNFEQIAALNPDLVLAGAINTPEQVKALEDLGLTVYVLANPDDLEGMYKDLQTVGELTGKTTEAQQLSQSLQERVAAVEAKIAQVQTRPIVFYELDGSTPDKPWTSGPNTFISKLIAQAGGQNVGDALESDWAQISQEALIAQNPALILLGDAAYGMTAEQVAQRPGWDVIAAVQNGRVLPFDDNLVSRPGPRLVDGLETLARLIHPELFE